MSSVSSPTHFYTSNIETELLSFPLYFRESTFIALNALFHLTSRNYGSLLVSTNRLCYICTHGGRLAMEFTKFSAGNRATFCTLFCSFDCLIEKLLAMQFSRAISTVPPALQTSEYPKGQRFFAEDGIPCRIGILFLIANELWSTMDAVLCKVTPSH